MKCQRYHEWIPKAALGSLDSSRRAELDAHLEACAPCRLAFEAERRLLAAIDEGVAVALAGTPSPDFAAGVRMRIAQESEPARRWWRRPVGRIRTAAALAALAALALAVGLVRRASQPPKPFASVIAERASMPSAAPNEVARVAPSAGSASALARRAGSAQDSARRRRRSQAAADDGAPQFQVLVEPGQWRAIVAAYREAQSGRADSDSPARQPFADEQPVELKPVEIDAIAIAELYPAIPFKSPGR